MNLDELVDRLLTAAADDAALAEFEALPPERQRCASNRMRERIGRLMRTQLVDAIPAADGFVRVAERVPSLRGLAHRCRGNALHFNARSPEARVELERSIEIYERGAALKAHCDGKLKQAELKVEKIVRGEDGQVTTEPAGLD